MVIDIKKIALGSDKRTLRGSEKRGLKKEKKRKCERCKKRFPEHILVIHHKRPIHTYEDGTKLTVVLQGIRRPSYDWKSNLMVVCRNCHADIHHKESKESKKKKGHKKSKSIWRGVL